MHRKPLVHLRALGFPIDSISNTAIIMPINIEKGFLPSVCELIDKIDKIVQNWNSSLNFLFDPTVNMLNNKGLKFVHKFNNFLKTVVCVIRGLGV